MNVLRASTRLILQAYCRYYSTVFLAKVLIAKRWFVCLSFISTMTCFAENSKRPEDSGSSREALENELRALMPKKCVFSGHFLQVKQSSHFRLESNGELFYDCNYGLIWHSKVPFVDTLIYKNNSLNFRLAEDGKRENLTSMSHRSLASFLLRLLDSDVSYFFETFDISYGQMLDSEGFQQKLDSSSLLLKPKSKHMKKAISGISMYLLRPSHSSATSDFPKNVVDIQLLTRIHHVNEDITDIVINNIRTLVSNDKSSPGKMCIETIGEQFDKCEILKLKKKAQNIK